MGGGVDEGGGGTNGVEVEEDGSAARIRLTEPVVLPPELEVEAFDCCFFDQHRMSSFVFDVRDFLLDLSGSSRVEKTLFLDAR